jgi:uncharacterized protein (TIGR03083 family)
LEESLTNADMAIAALRSGHDSLAAFVSGFDDDDLARPSGASDWDISQVLSHLGSGAEIGLATLEAALAGEPNPGRDFNLTVWDRWNAMTRRERADGFLRANETLTARYESLDPAAREGLRIDLGYMPAPVDVATSTRMRLSELALHSWDVRVGFDEHAAVAPEATTVLLNAAPEMLAWTSRPEVLNGHKAVIQVTTTEPASVFTVHLVESVSVDLADPESPDGTLTLPAEAWLRLVAGRLSPRHTPAGTATSGATDLDLLRQLFPGY